MVAAGKVATPPSPKRPADIGGHWISWDWTAHNFPEGIGCYRARDRIGECLVLIAEEGRKNERYRAEEKKVFIPNLRKEKVVGSVYCKVFCISPSPRF